MLAQFNYDAGDRLKVLTHTNVGNDFFTKKSNREHPKNNLPHIIQDRSSRKQ